MAGETILIVEDNPINMQLARTLLVKRGYNVLGAEDAEKALSLLQDTQPDLILMDIQLPGMDGLQLTQILKKDPKTKNILILALTAYAMKDDEQKVLNAGCDGYVSKPFDTRLLPETIAKLLEKKV